MPPQGCKGHHVEEKSTHLEAHKYHEHIAFLKSNVLNQPNVTRACSTYLCRFPHNTLLKTEMAGQPINANGMDGAPDRIEVLGGGVFDCCSGGFCFACFCTPCSWGYSAETAGEGSCLVETLCVCCVPCYYPIWFVFEFIIPF